MGSGAYGTALIVKFSGLPFWVSAPLAGVAAALVGLFMIFPLLRTKGFGFFVASFALGELLRLFWIKFKDPFGGPRGMINIPPPELGSIDFFSPIPYYFMVLAVTVVCLVVMYRLDRSRIGDAWKAIHWDDALAECTGIHVARYRVLAFTTSAFFAGIAGALLAHRLGAIDPKNFDVTTMVYLIIWVVVGGTGTFWGPIIGLTVMTFIFEWTRPLLEWRPLLFGAILIVFLVFLPGGLESLVPRLSPAVRQALPFLRRG
jgi:branched-chain amino acid transport system permease protein